MSTEIATKDETIASLRAEVSQRGLIGIKTSQGVKPYLTAEGAINAFREDYPEASIDLELIEFDAQKAIFKATISNDDKLLASGYGLETAGFTKYFEKAQTSAIIRALKALGYNTQREINELALAYNISQDTDIETQAIPARVVEQEQEVDLIELADQTQRRMGKGASEKQLSIITGNVDAGLIKEHFGKNPYLLTDGEANLAIKVIYGEIGWDDVKSVLENVFNG